jgi:hypothetical protein
MAAMRKADIARAEKKAAKREKTIKKSIGKAVGKTMKKMKSFKKIKASTIEDNCKEIDMGSDDSKEELNQLDMTNKENTKTTAKESEIIKEEEAPVVTAVTNEPEMTRQEKAELKTAKARRKAEAKKLIRTANSKSLASFIKNYLPQG